MKQLKLSSRAQRMQRFKSLHGRTGLNLVSLMDIFTILVFFLLVNSNTQQIPNSKAITLPTSIAEKTPRETLVIAITKTDILVQGRKVFDLADTSGLSAPVIDGLKQELQFQAAKIRPANATANISLPITIVGDENATYQLLRKILNTCRQTGFTQIAFAAHQKAKEDK